MPPGHTSGHTNSLNKPTHRHAHLPGHTHPWTYPPTWTYLPPDIPNPRHTHPPEIPAPGKDMGPDITPVNRQIPVKTLPLPPPNLFGGRQIFPSVIQFLDKGVAALRSLYEQSVQLGKMTRQQMNTCLSLMTPTTDLNSIAKVDIVSTKHFVHLHCK